jgi:site-specific recombinase XerD
MEFIKAEHYSDATKSRHKTCYEAFGKYLEEGNYEYSSEAAKLWLDLAKESCSHKDFVALMQCVRRLNDVHSNGFVARGHTGSHFSDYNSLPTMLKQELDEYLGFMAERFGPSYVATIRSACSRYFMYMHVNGSKNVTETTYSLLLGFHGNDCYKSYKMNDTYDDLIRGMLKYFHETKGLGVGYSMVLDRKMIPHIIRLDTLPLEMASEFDRLRAGSIDFPATEYLKAAEDFLGYLEGCRYSKTVLCASLRTLRLLFVFLDEHGLGYTPEISWLWFSALKPRLGSGWRQNRRVLKLFEQYAKDGGIMPEATYTYRPESISLLPEWCSTVVRSFLALRAKEGMSKSTIDMYRSSCLRFCRFLDAQGLSAFSETTPMLLQKFNRDDIHSTAEGKNAYNVKIRKFIEYLEDNRMVEPVMMHAAVSCVCAPKTRVVNVLSQDDIRGIMDYRAGNETPDGLRNSAMAMLGLKMGLRSSDVVNLKFSNIDWKSGSVTIIQQKTDASLSLPLPVEVGNALYAYISKGRPESSSPCIFIRHKAPYARLGREACSKALSTIIPDRESSGFHVARKTFATQQLRKGTPVNTIIDSLGHKSDHTVSKYLSMDEERMRFCPLSLSEAELLPEGGAC